MKPVSNDIIERDIKKYIRRNSESRYLLKYKDYGVPKAISVGDIVNVESIQKHLEIHTYRGEIIKVYISMYEKAEEYSKVYLFRCHKSFMIYAKYIKKYSNSNFILNTGEEIPVGRKYLGYVKEIWIRYEEEMPY